MTIFESAVTTFTDAVETPIAHGLGATPDAVVLVPFGAFSPNQTQSTPADGTNVYVTCSSGGPGAQCQVLAFLF